MAHGLAPLTGRLYFQGWVGEKQLNEDCWVLCYGARSRLFSKQMTDCSLSICSQVTPEAPGRIVGAHHETPRPHHMLVSGSKWSLMGRSEALPPDLWPTTLLSPPSLLWCLVSQMPNKNLIDSAFEIIGAELTKVFPCINSLAKCLINKQR